MAAPTSRSQPTALATTPVALPPHESVCTLVWDLVAPAQGATDTCSFSPSSWGWALDLYISSPSQGQTVSEYLTEPRQCSHSHTAPLSVRTVVSPIYPCPTLGNETRAQEGGGTAFPPWKESGHLCYSPAQQPAGALSPWGPHGL